MAKLSKNNKYNTQVLKFIETKEEQKARTKQQEQARKDEEDRRFNSASELFNNYINDPYHPSRLEHYREAVHRSDEEKKHKDEKERLKWIKANPDKDVDIDYTPKRESMRDMKTRHMRAYQSMANAVKQKAATEREKLEKEDAEFARREAAEAKRTTKTTHERPTGEHRYGPKQTDYYKKYPEELAKSEPEMKAYQKEIDKKVSSKPDVQVRKEKADKSIAKALTLEKVAPHKVRTKDKKYGKIVGYSYVNFPENPTGNMGKNRQNALAATKDAEELAARRKIYANPIAKGFERDWGAKREKEKQESWEKGVLEGPHGDQYEKNKAALDKSNKKIAQTAHNHPSGVGKAVARYNQSQKDKEIAAQNKRDKEEAQAKLTARLAEAGKPKATKSEASKKAYETRRKNREDTARERKATYETQRKPKQDKVDKLGKDAEEW